VCSASFSGRLGCGLPGGELRGERIEEEVLRSTIRREKRKETKSMGARTAREKMDSSDEWWEEEGDDGGGTGREAGFMAIPDECDDNADDYILFNVHSKRFG
jgi:hypothetical protein